MRSLRCLVLVCLGLACLSAASDPTQGPGVFVSVRGKYSERWTKVSKAGEKWVCRSSELPYFETSKDPLHDFDWNQLDLESKQTQSNCRDQVVIIDSRTKPSKKIKSCMDLPQTKYWVDLIAKRCGRL